MRPVDRSWSEAGNTGKMRHPNRSRTRSRRGLTLTEWTQGRLCEGKDFRNLDAGCKISHPFWLDVGGRA